MRKTKVQKGITLIALIITVVVLLILAAVGINQIIQYNIADNANLATKKYGEESEIEQIQLCLNGWEAKKYFSPGKTFFEYLKEQFGEGNVVDNEDETYTVILESGNAHKVKEGENLSLTKGIYIQAQEMPFTLIKGRTEIKTGTLTVILAGIKGEITWSNENNSVATISATSGNSIIVTAVSKGETKVTATCEGYEAEYIVKVNEITPVGVYVEYDVSYTDIYSGIQYTKKNGWRYLGVDEEGNKLLVSTAIPAILYYHHLPETLPTWWATDAEVKADNGIYHTSAGWNYDAGGSPNKYATYGLRYKFESIPFSYQANGTSAPEKNTGIFRKVGSISSGTNIKLNFRASGVAVEGVHNLTLSELNRATNSANGGNVEETSTTADFKNLENEAKGLFDMQDLTNYTASYYYWLSWPLDSITNQVRYVNYNYSNVNYYGSRNYGLRPVVVLSSNVEIDDTNKDGIYEIK